MYFFIWYLNSWSSCNSFLNFFFGMKPVVTFEEEKTDAVRRSLVIKLISPKTSPASNELIFLSLMFRSICSSSTTFFSGSLAVKNSLNYCHFDFSSSSCFFLPYEPLGWIFVFLKFYCDKVLSMVSPWFLPGLLNIGLISKATLRSWSSFNLLRRPLLLNIFGDGELIKD